VVKESRSPLTTVKGEKNPVYAPRPTRLQEEGLGKKGFNPNKSKKGNASRGLTGSGKNQPHDYRGRILKEN